MATQTTPEVTWAQRSNKDTPEKNIVYLTIAAPDVPKKDLKVDLQPGSLTFTGKSETKGTTYHVTITFFADVDVANSATHHTERDVEFVLRKKEAQAEYWPRLTKDKQKLHFLKTNFDKWVDEDEQEGVAEDNPMAGMEGMGGMGGMPGMPGMDGGAGGLGGLDFSKLGGMEGMGGGMEGLGAGAEDSDDEDMPDLEDSGDAKDDSTPADVKGKGKAEDVSEEASKPKIEEVN